MPFKVTDAKWLETEGNRVEQIILMPKYWHRAWTRQSLQQALLKEVGLEYSANQIALINDELHARGIVEDEGE